MKKLIITCAAIGTMLASPALADDCKPMGKVLQQLKTTKEHALVRFCQEEMCSYYFKNPQPDKKTPYVEVVANHDIMEEQQCAYRIRKITTTEFKRVEKNFKSGAYEVGDDEAGDYEGE